MKTHFEASQGQSLRVTLHKDQLLVYLCTATKSFQLKLTSEDIRIQHCNQLTISLEELFKSLCQHPHIDPTEGVITVQLSQNPSKINGWVMDKYRLKLLQTDCQIMGIRSRIDYLRKQMLSYNKIHGKNKSVEFYQSLLKQINQIKEQSTGIQNFQLKEFQSLADKQAKQFRTMKRKLFSSATRYTTCLFQKIQSLGNELRNQRLQLLSGNKNIVLAQKKIQKIAYKHNFLQAISSQTNENQNLDRYNFIFNSEKPENIQQIVNESSQKIMKDQKEKITFQKDKCEINKEEQKNKIIQKPFEIELKNNMEQSVQKEQQKIVSKSENQFIQSRVDNQLSTNKKKQSYTVNVKRSEGQLIVIQRRAASPQPEPIPLVHLYPRKANYNFSLQNDFLTHHRFGGKFHQVILNVPLKLKQKNSFSFKVTKSKDNNMYVGVIEEKEINQKRMTFVWAYLGYNGQVWNKKQEKVQGKGFREGDTIKITLKRFMISWEVEGNLQATCRNSAIKYQGTYYPFFQMYDQGDQIQWEGFSSE